MSEKMSVILFSGTADRLQAAATIVSGAAAMDVETHVFLTFWGLNAFRREQTKVPPPMSPEYGELGRAVGEMMIAKGVPSWRQLIAGAKDLGTVYVHACAMTMDLMGLAKEDLDPSVDDVIGVGTFIQLSEGGRTIFI